MLNKRKATCANTKYGLRGDGLCALELHRDAMYMCNEWREVFETNWMINHLRKLDVW